MTVATNAVRRTPWSNSPPGPLDSIQFSSSFRGSGIVRGSILDLVCLPVHGQIQLPGRVCRHTTKDTRVGGKWEWNPGKGFNPKPCCDSYRYHSVGADRR